MTQGKPCAAKNKTVTRPTATQVKAVTEIVRWYLTRHFQRGEDPGLAGMFCDEKKVGPFALTLEEFERGEAKALFRLLVATTLFQRRQDVQILRILRQMTPHAAAELTDKELLLALAQELSCPLIKHNDTLKEGCDLEKDPQNGAGCCTKNPALSCHLKRHTVWLKRYGHFGKVPTSLALVLKEAGWEDLTALREAALKSARTRLGRALALERALCRAWRVNQKIANMFLSALTNPDLSPVAPPWERGVDWTYFVVIDSNVDLFLSSIGYQGGSSYDARRDFLCVIAARVDLRVLSRRLRRYNPRLVQQALYLFMSAANRRALAGDCMHSEACADCPKLLSTRCPVRRA